MKFISEHSIKTNVVIVSAYSDLKLAVEAKALGASDFIAKPLMRSDLLSTIDRILAGSVSSGCKIVTIWNSETAMTFSCLWADGEILPTPKK